MKEIKTDRAPAAIGPYSQAVMCRGDTIYISGQLPIDPSTGKFAGNDIEIQTQQVLRNIQAILQEAGAEMRNVVKTTVLLKSMSDFQTMNEVYKLFFENLCPARAAYQVCSLPKDALVEIEATAVL